MQETPVTITIHGIQLAIDGGILALGIRYAGPLLRQYKIWSRMKERMNTLWWKHCKETGDRFETVENGHSQGD